MALLSQEEAIAQAVTECAITGRPFVIINSYKEVVWEFEADTKVDDDDLTYPVIVHMRGGTFALDDIAILMETVS